MVVERLVMPHDILAFINQRGEREWVVAPELVDSTTVIAISGHKLVTDSSQLGGTRHHDERSVNPKAPAQWD